MKARTEGEPAAKPLGVLRLSPSRAVFIFVLFGVRLRILICFWHLRYNFGAYFTYKAAFIRQPSSQQVKESKSSSFLSSCPMVHNTSSSIISDTKYCGKLR